MNTNQYLEKKLFLQFKDTVYITFEKIVLSVAYDIDNKNLYVYDDTSKTTTEYWPVSETIALIVCSGDFTVLENVMKTTRYKIVARPHNLNWVKITKEKTTILYRVSSSNVEYVGFDKTNSKLYVKYLNSGDIYEYSNIDDSIFNGIMNAESLGSFLHFFIKINNDTYPFRIISSSEVNISSAHLGNAGSPHPDGYMI